ncbi:MAG: MgtC/SapB family protein [Candidatus Omnitrophica bacterium]|nr:MgtC/SapB family protein [Candidatus Omnitrophota bacterium]
MLSDWVVMFRLLLAAVLSGVVGYEREFHGRAAGFRTHILLCVGSTLVMLTSIHVFEAFYDKVPCDPSRIAAGVVTGIGFLGAGTIMRFRASVRGLTTAASLWVVAGIGLAIGSGMYFGAIMATLLTVVALMMFSKIEHSMIRKDWYKTMVIEMREGMDRLKYIREVLAEHGAEITDFEVERSRDGANIIFKVGLRLHVVKDDEGILNDIGRLDGINYVKWGKDL